ncbi:hypothetical protein H4219_000088 [Mycoemilia scoparia]|uniref:Protein phosphatase 4 regulatory subunit 2 n=1 Tax=Mycoemilia scoparia TaxID=417184 RepID=A0A9W8DXQ2_9FUNG|nr:hypothetical protein H4219_000088 [Mycoemilia scoparia]
MHNIDIDIAADTTQPSQDIPESNKAEMETEDKPDDESRDYQNRIGYCLLMFEKPPFTIQRLCELLVDAERYYKSEHKFLRAIEKVVYVTSTTDEFPVTTDNPKEKDQVANLETEERFLPLAPSKHTGIMDSVPFDASTSAANITDPTEPLLGENEAFIPASFQATSGKNALPTSDVGVIHLSPTLEASRLNMLDPMAEGTGKSSPLMSPQSMAVENTVAETDNKKDEQQSEVKAEKVDPKSTQQQQQPPNDDGDMDIDDKEDVSKPAKESSSSSSSTKEDSSSKKSAQSDKQS